MYFRMGKVAVAVACLALLTVGTANAKKLKIKNLPIDAFQGVDENGDLDGGNFDGLVKLTVNLKTGKASVSGKAVVDNLFGSKVTFTDIDGAGIGDLIHDKYSVSASGKASYSGKYENVSL